MEELIFNCETEAKNAWEKMYVWRGNTRKAYDKWVISGSPEYLVLMYKDDDFEIFKGIYPEQVKVKHHGVTYMGSKIIITDDWIVMGNYSVGICFRPYIRKRKNELKENEEKIDDG